MQERNPMVRAELAVLARLPADRKPFDNDGFAEALAELIARGVKAGLSMVDMAAMLAGSGAALEAIRRRG